MGIFGIAWRKVREEFWEGVVGQIVKWLLALIGGSAMTALGAWLWQNWIPACASGTLVLIALLYLKMLIDALGKRRGGTGTALRAIAEEKITEAMKGPPPVGAATNAQVIDMSTTEAALKIAMPNVFGSDPLASIDPSKPIAAAVLHSSTGCAPVIDTIGMLRQVFIEYFEHPTKRWECTCAVDFHQVGGLSEASPLQLVLTSRDGESELAMLTAEHLPTGAGFVLYKGLANADVMPVCIEQAMGSTDVARIVPPSPNTYCYVEVRIAPASRIPHKKTTTRLDHELIARSYHYFFVPLVCKPLKNNLIGFATFIQRLQDALK